MGKEKLLIVDPFSPSPPGGPPSVPSPILFQNDDSYGKKSRIREILNRSTDADRSTNTISFFFSFFDGQKKIERVKTFFFGSQFFFLLEKKN